MSKRILIGIGVSAAFAVAAFASSPDDIQYPVPGLGGCSDETSCKTYCDDRDHARACLVFAREHHLMPDAEIDRFERLFDELADGGPGGCTSQESCETYCNDVGHIDACLEFAERHDVMPEDELEEARRVRDLLKRGVELPGGCTSKAACESYCENADHMEECLAFAEAAGFIPPEELEQAKKVLPLMQRGETPGACRSRESCDAYCNDDAHFEECIAFAEKAGFISGEELEMAKKTGGKGPGGCRRDACRDFCENPENQQTCFEFAREHGLLKEEDVQRMEEGRQQLMRGLEQAPPEVRSCVEGIVGSGIENAVLGPQTGDQLRACFQNIERQGPPPGFEGREGGPAGEFRGPGGCTSESECRALCEGNPEACAGFGGGQPPSGEFPRPPEGAVPPEFHGEAPPGFEGQIPPEFDGKGPSEFDRQYQQQFEQQFNDQYRQQYEQQYQQQLQQYPLDGQYQPPPEGQYQQFQPSGESQLPPPPLPSFQPSEGFQSPPPPPTSMTTGALLANLIAPFLELLAR